MRYLAMTCAALMIVGFASAQVRVIDQTVQEQPDERNITHGEFAVLLLKLVDTLPNAPEDPVEAMVEVKRLELVPEDWQGSDFLTQGEIAMIFSRFGAYYDPGDPDEYVSRVFAEALIRRELTKLRDYLAKRMGHGVSSSHILDEGVDRAVSPIYF